jgi:hypothetical protein
MFTFHSPKACDDLFHNSYEFVLDNFCVLFFHQSKSLIGEQSMVFSPPSIVVETLADTLESEKIIQQMALPSNIVVSVRSKTRATPQVNE